MIIVLNAKILKKHLITLIKAKTLLFIAVFYGILVTFASSNRL
jgi:hypothetical protein